MTMKKMSIKTALIAIFALTFAGVFAPQTAQAATITVANTNNDGTHIRRLSADPASGYCNHTVFLYTNVSHFSLIY
jgi:hypothetical protein